MLAARVGAPPIGKTATAAHAASSASPPASLNPPAPPLVPHVVIAAMIAYSTHYRCLQQ